MHLRSSLAIHMRACEEKSAITKYECKHCRQYFSLSHLSVHTNKCPLRPFRDDDDITNYGTNHGWKSTVTHNNSSPSSYRPLSPVRYTNGGLSPLSRSSPYSLSMSVMDEDSEEKNVSMNPQRSSTTTSSPKEPYYFVPIVSKDSVYSSSFASATSNTVPNVSNGLSPCRLCHRTFAPNRLISHESACRKAHRSRPIFDAQSQRMNTILDQLGTLSLSYAASSKNRRSATNRRPYSSAPSTRSVSMANSPSSFSSVSPSSASRRTTTTSWRQQHNELISSIREAKRYLRQKNGLSSPPSYSSSSSTVPVEPKFDNRVPCPYCDRSYAYDTAEKHIPICAKTMNRPRPPSSASPSRLTGYTYGPNSISRTSTVGTSTARPSFSTSINTTKYGIYGNGVAEGLQGPSGGSPLRPASSSVTKSSVSILPSLRSPSLTSSSSAVSFASSRLPSSSENTKILRPSTVSFSSDYAKRWSPVTTSRIGIRDTLLDVDTTRYNNINDNSYSSSSSSSFSSSFSSYPKSPSSIKLGYAMMNTSSSLTNNASSIINSNITSVNNPLAIRTIYYV